MNYSRFLNPTVVSVPPSGIRRFFDLASTMKDTISLGVGEPDFVTPYHIREAAIESLIDGQTQYTANRGLPELLREIALYQEKRFQLSFDPAKEILVTIGASEAIDIALRAMLSPGDEVLIPEPSYVSYAPGVKFSGGQPVPILTRQEDDFRLRPDLLESAITGRAKVLILPYPNNPTGAIMERADLEAIAEVVRRHELMVISDEIYAELVYDGKSQPSFASLPGMAPWTLTINGFSKAFAMTGWRVGYICGPAELIAMMTKIHQYTIMCAPRQGQIAAVEALRRGRENDYEDVRRMRDSYDRRRRLMVASFRRMGLDCFEPYGAFYVFPSIRCTGLSSEDFCAGLLQAQRVAAVPGTAFGPSGEGNIRCSYATAMEKLNQALDRIAVYLDSLKGDTV